MSRSFFTLKKSDLSPKFALEEVGLLTRNPDSYGATEAGAPTTNVQPTIYNLTSEGSSASPARKPVLSLPKDLRL